MGRTGRAYFRWTTCNSGFQNSANSPRRALRPKSRTKRRAGRTRGCCSILSSDKNRNTFFPCKQFGGLKHSLCTQSRPARPARATCWRGGGEAVAQAISHLLDRLPLTTSTCSDTDATYWPFPFLSQLMSNLNELVESSSDECNVLLRPLQQPPRPSAKGPPFTRTRIAGESNVRTCAVVNPQPKALPDPTTDWSARPLPFLGQPPELATAAPPSFRPSAREQ